MKKYIYIVFGIVAIIISIALIVQRNQIRELKQARDAYKTTSEALLRTTEQYKTESGLNAAKAQQMQLKIGELEQYRAEDMQLINQLRVENKRLNTVISAQTVSIRELQLKTHDSIIVNVVSGTLDTLKCVQYSDVYLDFVGCYDRNDYFSGRIEKRDSLKIIEHYVPKRFLGFLWKTKKPKRTELEIVSKDTRTKILGIEYIKVRQ